MRKSWRLAALVFAAALALLGFGAGRAGIAARDEALYSHTALRMARQGDWLTPRFLDRLALYKPPAVY
jgi:4-amino-4-deoxy-L-arabinose transferase-like glycosyltransferase